MTDHPTPRERRQHFVSASCGGEVCSVCRQPAMHKLGEEIAHDDPRQMRHNLTAYVCCEHFRLMVGPAAPCSVEGEAQEPPTPSPAPDECGDEFSNAHCSRPKGHEGDHWIANQQGWRTLVWNFAKPRAGSLPSPSPSGEEIFARGAALNGKGPGRPHLRASVILEIDSALSSLRQERDKVWGPLYEDARLESKVAHERAERLEKENSALRSRAEKAETFSVEWQSRCLEVRNDLASALEALRTKHAALLRLTRRGEYTCDHGFTMLEPCPRTDCADHLIRAALSGAPPAPAPAQWCGDPMCEHPMGDHFYPQGDRSDRMRCARSGCGCHSNKRPAPKPVAHEDAPAPEKREEVMPPVESDVPPVRNAGYGHGSCVPAVEPPSVAGAGAPSIPAAEPSADADLEGLIDETEPLLAAAYVKYEGSPCDILRSFSAEVARRIREPLEKEMEHRSDAQWHAAQDQIENLTRKLSEVTQERAKAYESARKANWTANFAIGAAVDRAKRETWEKAEALAKEHTTKWAGWGHTWGAMNDLRKALHAASSEEEAKP